MGVPTRPGGLLGFHNALALLAAGDCAEAARAFQDSRWERQTLARTERLAVVAYCRNGRARR